jgi:preprotein translocase subunit SecG
VFDLLESLFAEGIGAAAPLVAVVVVAFTFFVGVTLFVTLFHPKQANRDDAKEILRDLLAVFTVKRGGDK